MDSVELQTCQKCGKTMRSENFYTYKSGDKTELCKNCLTMHIDNFDPTTFLWALEKMDVPYLKPEWDVLRDRAFSKNPNLNGMSVFGKYLSKMKLRQYSRYGWADTEKAMAEYERLHGVKNAERAAYEEDLRKEFEEGKISEAEYKTMVSTETQNKDFMNAPIAQMGGPQFYDENQFIKQEDLPDYSAELDNDDKIYLAMKWGTMYKPAEWIELEKKYNEMMNSFDIQDADTRNTLILLCKTDLKMNQSIDCGDVEGFQKLSKVSESLRKSGKFTAAQNKEEKSDYVDSVGELVALCEKDGFIPRYATDIPQDKVDLTLKDMERYLNKLVTQDLGFGQQIEDALKRLEIQAEMSMTEAKRREDENAGELEDEDYEEFYEDIKNQKEADEELYNEGEE